MYRYYKHSQFKYIKPLLCDLEISKRKIVEYLLQERNFLDIEYFVEQELFYQIMKKLCTIFKHEFEYNIINNHEKLST